MEHTPGPWQAKLDDYQKGAWNIGPNAGETVARITGRAGLIPQAEANARLIAAAPDLLNALQSLAKTAPAGDLYSHKWAQARAAITKAKEG